MRFFAVFQFWVPITFLSCFQNVTATGSLTGVSSTKTCTNGSDTADIVWTAPATGTGPTANGAGKITISEEARRTARPANVTKSVSKIREAPLPEIQRRHRLKTLLWNELKTPENRNGEKLSKKRTYLTHFCRSFSFEIIACKKLKISSLPYIYLYGTQQSSYFYKITISNYK